MGGCIEGDVIHVTTTNECQPSEVRFPARKDLPYNKWRHELFNCRDICFSKLCLMAFFSPFILMPQLMQRSKLNACGLEGKHECTFMIIISLIIIIVLVEAFFIYGLLFLSFGQNNILVSIISAVLFYGFLLIFYWNVCLRIQFRSRYQLPETYCTDCYCDDCCIALWCNCCSLVQISRQTHPTHHSDENTNNELMYQYSCCSFTGLKEREGKVEKK